MSRHKARKPSRADDDWQVVIYESSNGKRPALEYLGGTSLPDQPRRELLLTVLAVAETGR
jgi:hypothetical protein